MRNCREKGAWSRCMYILCKQCSFSAHGSSLDSNFAIYFLVKKVFGKVTGYLGLLKTLYTWLEKLWKAVLKTCEGIRTRVDSKEHATAIAVHLSKAALTLSTIISSLQSWLCTLKKCYRTLRQSAVFSKISTLTSLFKNLGFGDQNRRLLFTCGRKATTERKKTPPFS